MGVQWKDVVKQVGKDNPGLKLSEILKLASPIYKKQKGNSSGDAAPLSTQSSKKSRRKSTKGRKGRRPKSSLKIGKTQRRRGRNSKIMDSESSNVVIV
jgi:hypothetical protein